MTATGTFHFRTEGCYSTVRSSQNRRTTTVSELPAAISSALLRVRNNSDWFLVHYPRAHYYLFIVNYSSDRVASAQMAGSADFFGWAAPLTSCSILTTTLMGGRWFGRFETQRCPIFRTLHISFLNRAPRV
jgi:hypothetical protein